MLKQVHEKKALKAFKEEKDIMRDWNGEVEAAVGRTLTQVWPRLMTKGRGRLP